MINQELLAQANTVYKEHHPAETNFAKCVFLSWYCSLGDCDFCYRSTVKQEALDAKKARRQKASIFMELLLTKLWNLELEFLTGGYGVYPQHEIVEICKNASLILGEKIWINFGVMSKPLLKRLQPYVKGILASLETVNPQVQKDVCPGKPLGGYLQLFENIGNDFEKSVAIIIGIGETREDIETLHSFIREHQLPRVTFFQLQPVKGTPFTEGPDLDYYATWIAKTRIAFPKIEIVAGISAKRVTDTETLLRAGANIITKFPLMKLFGSEKAKLLEEQLVSTGRTSPSVLSRMPDIDWEQEINKLSIPEEYKKEMITMHLPRYLKRYDKHKSI